MTTTPDLWRNPFIDNTHLTGNQRDGVVAATNGDQFFAVWADFENSPDDIIARKFDIVGNPLTGEVNLRPATFTGEFLEPAAVRLPIAGQADGLAVAFADNIGGGDLQIFLVRTDAALIKLENVITIDNSGDVTDHPSITSFSNGSLWVAFTNHTTGGDINARRVDAAGGTGAIIPLFDGGATTADFSDLTTLANGNFVAVFQTTTAGNDDVF